MNAEHDPHAALEQALRGLTPREASSELAVRLAAALAKPPALAAPPAHAKPPALPGDSPASSARTPSDPPAEPGALVAPRAWSAPRMPWSDRCLVGAMVSGALAACVIATLLLGELTAPNSTAYPPALAATQTQDLSTLRDWQLAFGSWRETGSDLAHDAPASATQTR